MKSFEESLQLSVGTTYPLERILSILSADEIKEEVRLYAIEVAKEALKNANSKLRDKDFLFHDDYELAEKSILSESNIPNLD